MTNTRKRFRVLEGGLARSTTPFYQAFHSAWVTDTRLMGVLCLCIHWSGIDDRDDLYQYFYFEFEGAGFDRFEWHDGKDPDALQELEASIIGGLGGRKKSLHMREALYLAQYFIRYNKLNCIPMPEQEEKYMFVLGMDGNLSEDDCDALFHKTCVRVLSMNALANYFLMRVFGEDFEAADWLSCGDVNLYLFPDLHDATFYRNEITMAEDQKSCRCESLVETSAGFWVIVTQLSFSYNKVSDFQLVSRMPITEVEAYLKLAHSEYVTVYQYKGNPEEFVRSTTQLTRDAMIMPEHEGRLFMIYNPTNDHVKESTYYLDNDLAGVYFISENGEFLASSSSKRNQRQLELDLHFSPQKDRFSLVSCLELNEPVLLQYLNSPFYDFMEFIDAISQE